MSYDQQGDGLGRPAADTPNFVSPAQPPPPPTNPRPPQPGWAYNPFYRPPVTSAPGSNRPVIVFIALIVLSAIIGVVVGLQQSKPAPRPTIPYAPTLPMPTLAPVPTATSTLDWSATPPDPTPYPRDREALTAKESAYYGNLRQGDCLNDPPDDLTGGWPTVDCSVPHNYQVAGFVDLSEGMPDYDDGINFEFSLSHRCNSLKATLSVPPALHSIVAISYPNETAWNDDVLVALCWVTTHGQWVGSVIDGTAGPA